MIELNEIIEATTSVDIELGGFKIPAVIRLNAITREFVESIKDEKDFDYILLEKAYKSIEIADGGKQIEPTVENLRKLPTELIKAMAETVGEKREELKKKP
jgi:hypothetical protein